MNLLIKAVQQHPDRTIVPLVIAADERLYGMIRENSAGPLLDRGVTDHPKDMDEEKLGDEAADRLEQDVAKREMKRGATRDLAQALK